MRQLRADFPGAVHHVYSRGHGGKDIFRSNADRLFFLEWLGKVVLKFGWILHVYSLMTNHFHLTIETPEGNLSKGMQELLTNYAQMFNRKRKRKGALFQGRFKSQLVEKESYLLELARYIVLNPVRAKMVERPEDYRWSSYRATVGLEQAPEWLTTSWILAQFAPSPLEASMVYRKFVDDGIGLQRSPWDDLKHQIYLGTDEWLKKTRSWVESEERSEEIPKAQRFIARPEANEVIEAVAEVMDIEPADIVEDRGGLPRMLVAHLSFYEGLIHLREIAKALMLRSAGHMSNLVRRCGRAIEQQRDVAAIAEACLARLRPSPIAVA
jgi:REP element-mobilizing transposase RayT